MKYTMSWFASGYLQAMARWSMTMPIGCVRPFRYAGFPSQYRAHRSCSEMDGRPRYAGSNTVASRTMALLGQTATRSEEHTSELQSHSDLVCRLLLEKKKKKKTVRCE